MPGRLAEFYGTDHQEFVVTPAAMDILPTLAWHFDEPFADASAIPTFYVARMSSQHVTVVLTGDGGDESFGGYQRYALMDMTGRIPVPEVRPAAVVRAWLVHRRHGRIRSVPRSAGSSNEMLD